VTGDPEHPVTRGRICSRGKLMLDHVYHKDRLNYPLKRKGERGAGQWERIPWDQALDDVSGKLSSLRDGGSGVGLVPDACGPDLPAVGGEKRALRPAGISAL
jgi:anaerobic selenocysteine-containing dehydrogenase